MMDIILEVISEAIAARFPQIRVVPGKLNNTIDIFYEDFSGFEHESISMIYYPDRGIISFDSTGENDTPIDIVQPKAVERVLNQVRLWLLQELEHFTHYAYDEDHNPYEKDRDLW